MIIERGLDGRTCFIFTMVTSDRGDSELSACIEARRSLAVKLPTSALCRSVRERAFGLLDRFAHGRESFAEGIRRGSGLSLSS